ncbi:MAG: HAD-IA family hydrolase [Bacilli bacterium]|nr:HAD-IA family hydrolase [Bacilli bacterium]
MKTDLGINPEDAMKEILSYSKPDPEMIALAKRFRQKHDVMLLSNCMDGMIEKIFAGSGFDDCFDRQFRSYQLHRIKPGKEIYEYVLQVLGPREKIIFFDDNQVNVDAGNHCGIPSVLFESVSQCEQVLFHEGY